MENASRAILFAGAILIAVMLISIVIYFFGIYTDYNDAKVSIALTQEATEINNFFARAYYAVDGNYYGQLVKINAWDAYNINEKAKDFNERTIGFNEIVRNYNGPTSIGDAIEKGKQNKMYYYGYDIGNLGTVSQITIRPAT